MKIIFKLLILGFAILLFGCSKKVESTEPSNSTADKKLITESLEGEKVKIPNIVNVPFDFKGVKIGMGEDDVKNIFPKLKNVPKKNGTLGCSKDGDITCENIATLINETPDVLAFSFVEGKLNEVVIGYNNKIFKDLFYGLKNKYGEPNELFESDSKDSLIKRIDEPIPVVGVYWKNTNGEKITIISFQGSSAEGLTKGMYLFESKEKVAKEKQVKPSNNKI